MVSYALLTSGSDTTNKVAPASYSTASVSPTPGRLYVALVYSTAATTAEGEPATVTGLGLTWTKHVDTTVGNPQLRDVTIYTARGTPTSGALTFAFDGGMAGVQWAVVEVDGADLTDPIVQVTWDRLTNTAVSINQAFPSAVDPDNGTLAMIGTALANPTFTPGTGWSELVTTSMTAPNSNALVEAASPAAQAITASWGNAANTFAAGVEIRAASAPPAGGRVKKWTGTAWVDAPVRKWNGTAWVTAPVARL